MEDNFDWLNVHQADQPSGEQTLPLLRLSGWKRDKHYDKNNPECIHYDLRWKVSHRENIRARHAFSGTDLDLVLAPSDLWRDTLQSRLESLLKDEDKFPGNSYACEETVVDISIERSRQRGISIRCKELDIDWALVDSHMEGLETLFKKGRKITLNMEFIYKEITGDSRSAKGKNKKKSATEAQKAQRAADAGLWTRVYKRSMHEEENEEEVDVNMEIPPEILNDVLADSPHDVCCNTAVTRPAADPGDVQGDRQGKLEEYCTWGLTQVGSDRWRNALQSANQVAMDQFLELNTVLQHPKLVADLMVKKGVQPGIALQFVSNVKKFQREGEKP
ncbi:hypothetical protein S40293_10156 [Stachybotrys chartarum IBT 40293]|nr:hypothetical protein S40293_10156 [Stachybotrys chartarum IBT 40293]